MMSVLYLFASDGTIEAQLQALPPSMRVLSVASDDADDPGWYVMVEQPEPATVPA